MAMCVCGAPVLHMRGPEAELLVVEQHEQVGAGPNRYVERAGRLVPVNKSWEGAAYVAHACPNSGGTRDDAAREGRAAL